MGNHQSGEVSLSRRESQLVVPSRHWSSGCTLLPHTLGNLCAAAEVLVKERKSKRPWHDDGLRSGVLGSDNFHIILVWVRFMV